jgi:hypothetical protein
VGEGWGESLESDSVAKIGSWALETVQEFNFRLE